MQSLFVTSRPLVLGGLHQSLEQEQTNHWATRQNGNERRKSVADPAFRLSLRQPLGRDHALNLAFGTRILANAESWDKLNPFQVPQPPGQDPWLVRARDAHLLVGMGRELPDTVVRLLAALKTYLKTDTGSPLQLLDQAEAHYRQHHMPGPYTGPAIAAGPLMHKPSRLVDFIFDHTRAFLSYDLKPVQGLDLDLVRMFCERPAMKLRYEQQFCTPHTTQLRARKIAASISPGGRVLVLGDDDLVSLALVHYGGDFKVDVLELEDDLGGFLESQRRRPPDGARAQPAPRRTRVDAQSLRCGHYRSALCGQRYAVFSAVRG